MEWDWKEKEWKKQKHQFKSYYCANCKQRKPCKLLTGWDKDWERYCCACYCQSEQQRAKEYSNYQQVYQRKLRERQENIQQLQLLKSYLGCKKCGSLEVDAYILFEESRLVCQPCLMSKEGGASSPISLMERQKWFKRYWKIELVEWLENYGYLPVNKTCAERCQPSAKQKWLKDKEHLRNCDCLEVEAKELVEMFANSLKKEQEKLKDCQCETSEKVRVSGYDISNYGYTYCERCEERMAGAGKMGVIKNRNDPRFWGLEVKEKKLCGNCLGNYQKKMPLRKKYLFNEYTKRGYWSKI